MIANPINLVVANLLDIEFLEFALWMALPSLTSVIISFLGLWLYFRKSIPLSFTMPEAVITPARHSALVVSSVVVIVLTLIGFFTEPLTGLPTSMAAVSAPRCLQRFTPIAPVKE